MLSFSSAGISKWKPLLNMGILRREKNCFLLSKAWHIHPHPWTIRARALSNNVRTPTQLEEDVSGRRRVFDLSNQVAPKDKPTWSWKDTGMESRIPLLAPILSSIRTAFLPVNYPQSAHPCYLRFHLWQTTETFVGAFVAVLCSQAMLESLGIAMSPSAVTAGAVAVQVRSLIQAVII